MAVKPHRGELITIPRSNESPKVFTAISPLKAFTSPPRGDPLWLSHRWIPLFLPFVQPAAPLTIKNTSVSFFLDPRLCVFLDVPYVSQMGIITWCWTGRHFHCTFGVGALVQISNTLTVTFMTSIPSSFVEPFTASTYVSTTALPNRHAGDHPANIVKRFSIPIAPGNEPRIRVFLKK